MALFHHGADSANRARGCLFLLYIFLTIFIIILIFENIVSLHPTFYKLVTYRYSVRVKASTAWEFFQDFKNLEIDLRLGEFAEQFWEL